MAKSPDELSNSSSGMSKSGRRKEKFRLTIFLMVMTLFSHLIPHKICNKQEPITRSLHPNCTLESTLSRIFLFLEL